MKSKAFELLHIIDVNDALRGLQIHSLELYGSLLFVGTTQGLLIQFHIDENTIIFDRKTFLLTNGNVSFIRCASPLNRIFTLCDDNFVALSLVDYKPLSISCSVKLKGISAIFMSEDTNHSGIQTVFGRKKQILIATVYKDEISIFKSIECKDPCIHLAMNESSLLAAHSNEYILYNIGNGSSSSLFPFSEIEPCIISGTEKNEYLLNAPCDIGMFVTSEGISVRPPIHWSQSIKSFVIATPYILSLPKEKSSILIYSTYDSKLKQILSFPNGSLLKNCSGTYFITSSSDNLIFQISPISLERQIEAHLKAGSLEEALALAETQNPSLNPYFPSIVCHIRAKLGFKALITWNLKEAKEYFTLSQVDLREVISIYPRLLPWNSKFVRSLPPLHELPDITSLTEKEEECQTLRLWLMDLLKDGRKESMTGLMEIDTALLKLYAQNKSGDLFSFLVTCSSDYEEGIEALQQFEFFHGLALFHQNRGHYNEALKLWFSLLNNEIVDEAFPGINFVISILFKAPEEFLWQYGDVLLRSYSQNAIQLFTTRSLKSNEFFDETANSFLLKYPRAHRVFLEHLILGKKTQNEKYHTQLSLLYTDLLRSNEEQGFCRQTFVDFILSSNFVKPNFLLSRIHTAECHYEKAILYGKMGHHEKALQLLVHRLKDLTEAEKYCEIFSTRSENKDSSLFTLLTLLLDPLNDKDLESYAIDLLNRKGESLKLGNILEILPKNWSLSLIQPSLYKAIRALIHSRRISQIETGLAKTHNLDSKYELYKRSKSPIVLLKNTLCFCCKKMICQDGFARRCDGSLVHIECLS